MNMNIYRQLYNHCERKYLLNIKINENQSWKIREKYKINLKLIKIIDFELYFKEYLKL